MKAFDLDGLSLSEIERLVNGPAPAAHLHRASIFVDSVVEDFYSLADTQGGALPWSLISDKFLLRESELTVWAGYNGSGKSMILGQVICTLMAQDLRCCVVSLEMPVKKTLKRMVRQCWKNAEPPVPYIKTWHQWTDDRLWIYNHVGNLSLEMIEAIIRYACEVFKIQHFVLDSLMMISSLDVTDYDGHKRAVNMLSRLAKETQCHIHLVAHARKGSSEAQEIDRMSVKGASEITDQADNVVLLWKNPKPASDDPTHVMTVAKQRHEAWEGKLSLAFHEESTQFIPHAGHAWAMDLIPELDWQPAYEPGNDVVVWGQ